jgi:ribose transport system substrate-binding protein
MKKTLLLAAGSAVLALAVTAATAQEKKELAVVVKGVDNPFFEQINLGCQQWNAENADSEYVCTYQGPASTAGEVQIVEDLITKGVSGIAISPSNAVLMANMLRDRNPSMPIMTIDADLGVDDRDLRATYLGTDNYLMGVDMAEQTMKLKPNGGTVCYHLGNVAADNINARAQGFRDTISGEEGLDRLTGQGGWTEVDGCPIYTDDQADFAAQSMADTFIAHSDLDAFVLLGGWAQFAVQAYAQTTDQVMDRLQSGDLVIVAGDTLPPQTQAFREGRSQAQVGQRPFEMGYRAPDVLIQLINGESVDDPLFTGLDICNQDDAGFCGD